MPDDPTYRRLTGVIETDLGTELILLDPASQAMFSLNEVGSRVWRLLESSTPGEILADLVLTFEVSREQADADVRALLRQLVEAGLLLVDA